MKKFFLSLFSVFVLVSLLFSSVVFAESLYSDVNEDHENYNAISFLNEHKIAEGYGDGTFGPDNVVTRAEAMKIMTLAFDLDVEKWGDSVDGDDSVNDVTTDDVDDSVDDVAVDDVKDQKVVEPNGQINSIVNFSDVGEEEWFFKYVMAAYESGIVSGYANNEFKPHQTISLAETLKVATLMGKFNFNKTVSNNVYSDVLKDEWFAQYFMYARDNNIVMADDYGNVIPHDAMTRAEFAEVLYRMMSVKDSGKAFDIAENWGFYESEVLPFKIKYDETWDLNEKSDEVVFLHSDKEYMQASDTRMYPNSAVLRLSLDSNDSSLSAVDYFANLKSVFSKAKVKDFKFGDLSALEVSYNDINAVDWYIYLPNSDVLLVFTEYGDGILSIQMKNTLKAMLSTLKYVDLPVIADDLTPNELKSEIFARVLVENKGKEIIDQIDDFIIIETDSIGVGTGPVDYYFSESLSLTVKYERSDDVILATKNEQTSAF